MWAGCESFLNDIMLNAHCLSRMSAFSEGFDILRRSRALVIVFVEAKQGERERKKRFTRVDRFALKSARELDRGGLNETAEDFFRRIMLLA